MTVDPDLAGQALSAAGDAIVTVDLAGRITSWNQAAESVLGHATGEAVGQTLALVIPEGPAARHIAAFKTAVSSRELAHHGQPAHVRAIRSDRREIPLIMTLGLLTAPADPLEVTGAVAVLRRADVAPVVFAE